MRRALLAGAVVISLFLSGCAALGIGKPPGFDAEGVSIYAITCGDFAAFEAQYRESGDPDIVDSVTTYTGDGATVWDSAADYFVAACDGAPSETVLGDLPLSIHNVACRDYAALDAGVKAEWIAVWSSEYGVDLQGRSDSEVAAIFDEQCDALGGSESLWNASISVEERLTMVLSHEWVDGDGYSYRFELTSARITASSSIVDSLPGQADLDIQWSLSGRVTNLTPGRNAPYPFISIVPAWDYSSAACSGIQDWSSEPAFAGSEAALCTIFSNPIDFYTNIELAQPIPQGGTVESDFQGDSGFSVLEADAASAVTALSSPLMWAMGLESSDTRRACLLKTGFWLVAATGDPGCPPTE